jgi:hypothetical protein
MSKRDDDMFAKGGSCHPETPNYWWCHIGPVIRKDLPFGSDFPMRIAIQRKFEELFDTGDYTCSSGWGMTTESERNASYASNNDETKRALIQSFKNEGKKVPRGLRCWELLFEEEKKKKKKR